MTAERPPRAGGAPPRQPGDVWRVPVGTDARTGAVRTCPLVVDGVRQTADGPLYTFRDHTGPVIHLRAARLRWLQRRFARARPGA